VKRGTIGLVGAGAVGPAIALRLIQAGWSVATVASSRLERAQNVASMVGAGCATTENPEAARSADLLLLAVPDREIAGVAAEIATAGVVRGGTLVLHFSGALSSEILEPLRPVGAVVGSIHPLQSFADLAAAVDRLSGTFLFYEGDDPDRIREVAEDLGGRPMPIDPAGKVLYHAGAAAACNLAVAMIDLGIRLFGEAGIGREDALAALLPLIKGTVDNLSGVGLPDALTGPVARGDVGTVKGHLKAIREHCPEFLPAYAKTSLHAIRVGLEKGSLGPVAANALTRILSDPRYAE